MQALEKLQDLKKMLDRNLSTRSSDILPIINEVIAILEEEAPKEVKVSELPIKEEPIKGDVLEIKEDNVAEQAMEYLKSIKAKGIYNYKSEEKLIARAIKEGFTL